MKVSESMLEKAAEARAQGLSWVGVGKTVNRSAERVRQWPRDYPRRWFAALKRFEKDILQNAAAESVNTLRNQLRVKDERMKQNAAVNLLRHESRRKPRPARKGTPKPASTAAIRMAEDVEALSDDDLAKLLDETAASVATGHCRRPL